MAEVQISPALINKLFTRMFVITHSGERLGEADDTNNIL